MAEGLQKTSAGLGSVCHFFSLPCVLSIDAYFQVFLYLSSGVNNDSWGCYLIRLMVFLWKVIDNSRDLG